MEAVPISLHCYHSPLSNSHQSRHYFRPIPKSDSLSLVSNLSVRPKPNRSPHLQSTKAAMLHSDPVVSDLCASALSSSIALLVLRFWGETATRRIFDQNTRNPIGIMVSGYSVVSDVFAAFATVAVVFAFLLLWKVTASLGLDQKLNRKLVHISIGLVFMLCWPLFSSGSRGALFAALTPGVNIIRMLLLGLGIWKDEATVKSMSRFGDHRELLKGPLYYALTITLSCAIYWRTSPIAIAAICNLCAGDGIADVVGRRFGNKKLPYNPNKSIAGSVAMLLGGFLASVMYMYYFSTFGYVQTSWDMVLGFLVVSIASTIIESLPISTSLDDNLTVSLTSILIGSFVF